MPQQLKQFKKDDTRSLMEAGPANELVDAINAIMLAKVTPDGFGKFVVSGNNLVLDLSSLLDQLQTIIAREVAKATGGSDGSGGSGGSGGGGGGNGQTVQQQIDTLNSRLDNASITASCSNGNVTVTLKL